ncbi:MAG: IgGFc-binding protein, partial [Myxococcota bacterium]
INIPNNQVAPGSLEIYTMPTTFGVDGSGLFNEHGWQVTASIPVTVHQFNPLTGNNVYTNDASLLLPTNALGNEYIAMSWQHRNRNDSIHLRGFINIVATSPGTTQVTVTPSTDVMAGNGVPRIVAGQPQVFSMTFGQVLNLETQGPAGADLTGSIIVSDQNIAVFGGHECANIPTQFDDACDHVEQQLYPLSSWGNRYLAIPFSARSPAQQDTWVLVGGEDGVTVRTNPPQPIDGIQLARGQKVTFSSADAFEVSANGPILLGQFMWGSNHPNFVQNPACGGAFNSAGIGDPAFTLAVPVQQYRNDYIVLTPPDYEEDYLNIVAPNGAQVSVDGVTVNGLLPVGNTGFSYVQYSVPDGVHRVESNQPFGLVSYGYDCFVSYAYPGGLNLENIDR